MSNIAATEDHYTSTGVDNRKLMMWIFLGSDCLFFGSFISTYLVYRNRSLAGPYPNEILDIPITTVSTFVLLMSSLAMVMGLSYVQQGRQVLGRYWTLATALLGMAFLGFQVYEFSHFAHIGLTPRTNIFGTTFFTMTGFHGAHVTFGVIWLLILAYSRLASSFKQKMLIFGSFLSMIVAMSGLMMTETLDVIPHMPFSLAISVTMIGILGLIASLYMLRSPDTEPVKISKEEENLELAGLYWHFVDIVWIVIFTVVYLVSAKDGAPLL
ncbi:MAG: cytochrome oxidase subunit III [Chloroflexi bacterium]|nr:cytochrome oxidase subunit III [Chloroflexota bacterium]|tara:strand:+ start:8352 stop:9158 length:807 start_codon:yes stop_codon:yes gene_type:complete